MSNPLQIQQDHELSIQLVRSLLGSLMYRKQMHGSGGIPYGAYTTEIDTINQARAFLDGDEKSRKRVKPNGEW